MGNLTKEQKIIAYALIVLGLILLYLLSAAILVALLYPFSGKSLSRLSGSFSVIRQYFDVWLPFKALSKGFIAETIRAFLYAIFLSSTIGSVVYIMVKRAQEKRNIYGKAKWSGEADIKKNNLRAEKGIIVGRNKKGLLKFGGQEFVSVGAPTRSGKGVGIVIPNLLEWEDSLIVLDVKQECFSITSKYRALPKEEGGLGQKVFLFDPFSFNTHRYNPLGYLDFSKPDIEMQIQALANSLYPVGKGGKDFFALQAQSIFVAIVYLLGILKENQILASSFTLTTLAGALQGVKIEDLNEQTGEYEEKLYPLQETVETVQAMGLLSPTIYSKFLSFFEQAEAKDQFAGVKSSYETPLKVFQDPLFEMATGVNDFDFRDLRKDKITVYIGITPENISTARPIVNLLFTQLIYENIRQGLPDTNPDLKHSVLMLMDEFTSIGYMEQYQVAIAYMAGYNIRSLIIYQNQTQLAENPPLGYGDKGSQTLLENHSCNIIYRPKNPKMAEEISKRIGNITATVQNNSINKGNVSTSNNLTQRALELPQEIMALKDDEEIIFCNAAKVRCKKALFYTDPYFINKLKLVSPGLREIKGLPSKAQLENAYQKGETAIPLPNQKAY
ncbi:type IV secretory system conjugative DNA transfer family protein [Aggregatibacter actinomycetemcomitans]|uniref:type IV secretory system conjugative DNA transfer family protein n=1 Tax=Aggregatibacter actinomycetemcomitans TaxID=714 RepID=UPI00197C9651|nr:type IV secretory system conjugative DNA transfer family protein [Aggregatibacter actinomycetemcomitans]MBN6078459.1 type IV secretory system conjugative DNA transfer family protein [Aggregatibacter actinomycetemcomitans]MBN6078469.1 type IV secretory system conjugative DNA transfer family protein [Aggregatibacter actinomycetemcomitans]MBN6078852.1 type IV secretory system conjugative DNA transfer family protein [Aggregatibacter actinomycetemcomitans]MBN6080092.1 type IV secretory system con